MGFFDTAEAYNVGRSEIALGEAARAYGRPVLLASKFAPFPYRVSTAQFASALDKTLERLGRDSLDLYYLHFPYSPRGVRTWMRAMAHAVAWLLKRDDHVIAIPGATRPEHVRENSGALSLQLSDEEFAAIDRASAPAPAR